MTYWYDIEKNWQQHTMLNIVPFWIPNRKTVSLSTKNKNIKGKLKTRN